jgi:8-oxo-dGTP pyrophosphatase MutT (NUDIX family)
MSTSIESIERTLHRAVRGLDDPPSAPGWNHAELSDLLNDIVRRPAAVLVPIIERPQGLFVLFTRRTENLTQHAGQISFPGGGVESNDRDIIAAALRETREEVGIASNLIHPFGYLDCFETVSGYCVTPVVADVDPSYVVVLDPQEVAEAFEVPFEFFLDPTNLRRRRIEYRGRPREIFEFVYEGKNIWGATAAMLLSLVRRMEAVT